MNECIYHITDNLHTSFCSLSLNILLCGILKGYFGLRSLGRNDLVAHVSVSHSVTLLAAAVLQGGDEAEPGAASEAARPGQGGGVQQGRRAGAPNQEKEAELRDLLRKERKLASHDQIILVFLLV